MGRPYPGHRVAVIDEDGNECPPGVAGDVAVNRYDVHGDPDPIFFLGYWKNPEATHRKFTGDWCRTGDLATRDEDVRMNGAARTWSAAAGGGGAMSTDAPLDELSFIYFVRTLRLADGDSYSLARHYDAARNPVRVRVVGRGVTVVPAGRFHTVQVEMRVRDPIRYQGEGVIRLHLTDDARRLLVRMESSIPRAGRMVLSLESGSGGCGTATAARRTD